MIDTTVQGLAATSVAVGAKGFGFSDYDDPYYWNLLNADEQYEAEEMEKAHKALTSTHQATKPADRWTVGDKGRKVESDEYKAWNVEADRIRKAGRQAYVDFVVRLWESGRVSH